MRLSFLKVKINLTFNFNFSISNKLNFLYTEIIKYKKVICLFITEIIYYIIESADKLIFFKN